MKKKILLGLLVAVLLAAGLAGGAYAAIHEPVKGDKLIGFGSQGAVSPTLHDSSVFFFTNPDCVNNIVIERVSIVRGNGTVVYEGPYLQILPDGTREPRPVLKPHMQFKIELWNWMPDGSGGWLSEEQAREVPIAGYTVEIEWNAKGETLPPMGYGQRTQITIIPGQPANTTAHYIPMENMRQEAK